jgi:nitroimidazol reductase NimA-like FMN-containing flavoprotein (pyridoxamine 5'-phosphate oxidase superfamily)
MYETTEDVLALQRLLDESMAVAGPHLQALVDDKHRVPAASLVGLLQGACVLDLATVTASGEPRVAPVDGVFYRGRWHFGSSPESARMRHLRQRPAVSACHTKGESLAVIVHGYATEISVDDPLYAGFAEALFSIYVPRYGEGWRDFARSHPFAVITPKKMFARQALPEELAEG